MAPIKTVYRVHKYIKDSPLKKYLEKHGKRPCLWSNKTYVQFIATQLSEIFDEQNYFVDFDTVSTNEPDFLELFEFSTIILGSAHYEQCIRSQLIEQADT
jgi:hypothetical protein